MDVVSVVCSKVGEGLGIEINKDVCGVIRRWYRKLIDECPIRRARLSRLAGNPIEVGLGTVGIINAPRLEMIEWYRERMYFSLRKADWFGVRLAVIDSTYLTDSVGVSFCKAMNSYIECGPMIGVVHRIEKNRGDLTDIRVTLQSIVAYYFARGLLVNSNVMKLIQTTDVLVNLVG